MVKVEKAKTDGEGRTCLVQRKTLDFGLTYLQEIICYL